MSRKTRKQKIRSQKRGSALPPALKSPAPGPALPKSRRGRLKTWVARPESAQTPADAVVVKLDGTVEEHR